jgi:alcohol dehydrogenase
MKATIIRQHGSLAELSYQADWPQPAAGEGDVVVKVRACALNYHDLFTLRGMPGIKVPMPIIMGIDVAGEIESIGPGVSGWQVGDRVLVDPNDRKRGKLLGEVMDGGLAQFCVVGAHMLVKLPENVGFAEAAALPVAYGTAYRMMMARGRVQAGERVLILGASGGVGTCCVQLAKLAGAHVTVAASSQEKLDRLAAIGADDGINYATENFMEVVHRRYGKPRVRGESGGMDIVVNFTGGDTWVPSLRSLTRGGRLLTCGATAGFDPRTDIRYLWTFELNVHGSNSWERPDLFALLDLLGRNKLVPVVDRVLPLQQTAEAFRLLEQREVFGKVVIDPWL